jgi:protein O-mannosyl-transferase
MASGKKKKKKDKIADPDAPAPKPQERKQVALNTNTSKKLVKQLAWICGILGFILYLNTVNHLYVLDDFSIIKENTMTKKGLSAMGDIFTHSYRDGFNKDESGLYRPLSKAMFAIEWQIAPDKPSFSHWVNIILYGITCALLFVVLQKILKTNPIIPLAATVLFAAHPIHTEVVANIKSRDEILSFLFIIISMLFVYRYVEENKPKYLLIAITGFFLSLLSKESSITYLAVVPITIYFFTKAPLQKLVVATAAMSGVVLVYLLIHHQIIGNIGLSNVPVVDNSLFAAQGQPAVQKATAIYILGMYLKLLVVPHPLSCDYSYNTIPLINNFGDPLFLLSLLLHLGLFAYAIVKIKKKTLLSYAILFYFITMSIASNIFVLIGTNMAERLLYLPSLGFTLAVAVLLARLFKINEQSNYGNINSFYEANKKVIIVLLVIIVPFAIITWDRNKDWKSVKTLFDHDVKIVPNSAHMLFYHANQMTNKDSLAKMPPIEKEAVMKFALDELQSALKIYEQFPDAHNQVGKIQYEFKQYDNARKSYQRALELNSSNATYHNNFGTCLFSTGQYAESEKAFKKAIELQPSYPDALCNLGSVYGTLGEINLSQGKQAEARAYFEKAIVYFKKTIEEDEGYLSAYNFLAATYKTLGDQNNMTFWSQKYEALKAKQSGK